MDWFAGIAEVVAVWMVGNYSRWGFVIGMICNLAWIYVAVTRQVHGLLPVSLAMLAVNGRNFRKWSQHGT